MLVFGGSLGARSSTSRRRAFADADFHVSTAGARDLGTLREPAAHYTGE